MAVGTVITAIAGLVSAGAGVAGAVQARKESKKAKKEAAAQRAALMAEQEEERKKRFARLTARGRTQAGSLLTSPTGTIGSPMVEKKVLLGA